MLETIWNKLNANHKPPSEGMQACQWFLECNSDYTEYKTMLSTERVSDAPPLLPVGFMEALAWAKK